MKVRPSLGKMPQRLPHSFGNGSESFWTTSFETQGNRIRCSERTRVEENGPGINLGSSTLKKQLPLAHLPFSTIKGPGFLRALGLHQGSSDVFCLTWVCQRHTEILVSQRTTNGAGAKTGHIVANPCPTVREPQGKQSTCIYTRHQDPKALPRQNHPLLMVLGES